VKLQAASTSIPV